VIRRCCLQAASASRSSVATSARYGDVAAGHAQLGGACPCEKIETARESLLTFREPDLEASSRCPRGAN
jgi:hypothetical protein